LPGQAGSFEPLPAELHPGLRSALATRGIEQLYAHQAQAWRCVQAGRDLLIATPTASGKSLCYNLPVLQAALERRAKALYLFPTKALAQDQVAELLALNRAGELGIGAYTFDGDTPSDARKAVRTKGDVVVSNPDMLHSAILPHHTKWAQFFRALEFVVIDELHIYRGVFGSHVANVLRRLDRIAAHYGVRPRYLMCTATLGNPLEHAQRLVGRTPQLISESGAPTGDRHLLFVNPPPLNPDLGIRVSSRSQVTRIARQAIKLGLKTLVFEPSRLMVEVVTKYLKDVFDADPRRPERIRAYRGGHLPDARRLTERKLRAGELDCVVSTSALELGVDVGALDVCILDGYPGSVAATWQRLGRAGRRQQAALGVLVAGSDALDQYVVRHPEFFLTASPEHARIAPDQELILFDQLRCAAFELPFRHDEPFGGSPRNEYLAVLAEEGVLHRDGDRYHWIDDSYPAQAVNLRSVADGNFVVVDLTDGKQVIIAEVDYTSAALTLYEGAIYLVQSQPWQVERLDWVGRKAFVTRTRADYYTDAIDYTRLKPLDSFARRCSGAGEVQHGEVHVVRRVTGYKKIRYYSHENIGYGPVSLPDQNLQSTAVWWSLPASVLDQHFSDRQAALDGFLGAARVLQTVALVSVLAEGRDLCRAVAGVENDGAVGVSGSFQPTLYLYDNYPGGIGLSEPLFHHADHLLAEARGLLAGCDCHAGCPACVGPVLEREERGGGDSKTHALTVLRLLQQVAVDARAIDLQGQALVDNRAPAGTVGPEGLIAEQRETGIARGSTG
jgi:DEAD/DEAH box helicase domain-containing protein